MPKVVRSRSYEDKSADDCFTAAKVALTQAGFTIWKTRPIGWLVIAHRETSQGKISASFCARPTEGSMMTLSISCDEIHEKKLNTVADEVLSTFETELF